MKYFDKRPKNNFNIHNNYYNVEKIISRKIKKNKKYYLIKWENFPLESCTWEPLSHLKNVLLLVQEFDKNYPDSICIKDLQKVMNNVYRKKKGIKRKHKKINQNEKPLKLLESNKFVIDLEKDEILNFDKDENYDKKTVNTDTDINIDFDEEKEINTKKLNEEKKPENMKLINPIIIW